MSSYRTNYGSWQQTRAGITPSTSNNNNDHLSSNYGGGSNRYGNYSTSSTSTSQLQQPQAGSGTFPSPRGINTVNSLRRKYASFNQKHGNQLLPDNKNDGEGGGGGFNRFGFQNKNNKRVKFKTRSTSPTPPAHSTFLQCRRNDIENVIEFETDRRKCTRIKEIATQTEEMDLKPSTPSRVSSLTSRFLSLSTVESQPKPDNIERVSSPWRSPIAEKCEFSDTPPTPPSRIPLSSSKSPVSPCKSPVSSCKSPVSPCKSPVSPCKSPGTTVPGFQLSRGISSVSNLNKSLSNMKINCEDSEDTESESSYDENYPLDNKVEDSKFQGGFDKPPKYPLSPKFHGKNIKESFGSQSKLFNIRSISTSSNSSAKVDSSSEDLSQTGCNEIIPPPPPPLQRSTPDWLEIPSKSDTEQTFNYKIRKMDSSDTPWWCEQSPVLHPSSPVSSSYQDKQFGYKIRKMDSCEMPWSDNNSESSSRNTSNLNILIKPSASADEGVTGKVPDIKLVESVKFENNKPYVIRKFDSGEKEWWTDENVGKFSEKDEEKSNEKSSVDWWGSENRGKCNEPPNEKWWGNENTGKSNEKQENSDEGITYKKTNSFRIRSIQDNSIAANDDDASSECSDCSDDFPVQTTRSHYADDLDNLLLYIGNHTNIDDLLGREVPPPAAPVTPTGEDSDIDDFTNSGCKKIPAHQVRIHDGTAQISTIRRRGDYSVSLFFQKIKIFFFPISMQNLKISSPLKLVI